MVSKLNMKEKAEEDLNENRDQLHDFQSQNPLRGHENPMLTPCYLCRMEFHIKTYKTTRKPPC